MKDWSSPALRESFNHSSFTTLTLPWRVLGLVGGGVASFIASESDMPTVGDEGI